MLESMIGPDMMKKMMAKAASLICVILAWMGLVMVIMATFVPVDIISEVDGSKLGTKLVLFHAHFWPMFVAFGCAGVALIVGGVKTKINLGYITFGCGLWVMLNAIMGWIQAPAGSGMGEMIGPVMLPLQVMAGFSTVLGGVCGIGGAGKYLR